MIVFSVAHTKLAQGAQTKEGLTEYEVSKAASRAAFESLFTAGVPCAMFEIGKFSQVESVGPKQLMPSRLASLAVEIHCNSSGTAPSANYSECIHYPGSKAGKEAATFICDAMKKGFNAGSHKWPARGPRADGGLFFLKGKTPSVIVEGVFVSNQEQAAWLATNGGPEAYGLLVAEGLKQWWSKQ